MCSYMENPIYDPSYELVPYGSVQDGAGSDPHWSPEGHTKKEVARWSRECTNCGKKEYTTKQEPVIKEYIPKF